MEKSYKKTGILGLIAPIVTFSTIFTAIATYTQFNWFTNALSDLGVQKGTTALLFNFGLIIGGTLFLIFALGLFSTFEKKNKTGKIGSVIFCLACIALIGIGMFNANIKLIHFYASVAFFILLPISLIILVKAFWEENKELSVFTLLISILTAMPWIIFFIYPYASNVAIPELISGLTGSIWTTIVGLKIFNQTPQDQKMLYRLNDRKKLRRVK